LHSLNAESKGGGWGFRPTAGREVQVGVSKNIWGKDNQEKIRKKKAIFKGTPRCIRICEGGGKGGLPGAKKIFHKERPGQ